MNTKLDADQHSKLYVKFAVKDKLKPSSPLEPQQTFLRFTHVKSGREIVFLAQTSGGNGQGQYQADVDFATQAKNFRQTAGVYTLELIVSDSLVENPVRRKLGELNLQLIDATSSSDDSKAALYAPKPEIKHIFRPPEPTPPAIVSTVFSALCAAPLLLMFILVRRVYSNFILKFSFYNNSFSFKVAQNRL